MASLRRLGLVAASAFVGLLVLLLCLPFLALATPPRPPTTGSTATAAGTDSATAATVAGIPLRVLAAYKAVNGWCPGLRWELIAGIGAVESGNATTGGATVNPQTGEVTPWIFGPPLDGSAGLERLPIGPWLGWFGLTGPWQQAVGPLQFLPGTFTEWAVSVDGGVADPHNIDDAVATAANYLCQGHSGAITDERAAVLRYNDSQAYATEVLAYADSLP